MKQESGQTLVEFLVVIMIVGILAAIALPTFIAPKKADHRHHHATPVHAAIGTGGMKAPDHLAAAPQQPSSPTGGTQSP